MQVLERQNPSGLARVVYGGTGKKQTYRNIAYLLLSLPLGTFYFVLLVTGLCVGASTVVVWIGIPVLAVTMLLWRGLGNFERTLAVNLLGMDVLPFSAPPPARLSWMRRMLAYARDPLTWKSLVYLFLEFPFGIFFFTVTVTFLATSLALLLFPVAYLFDNWLVVAYHVPAHDFTINIITQNHIQVDGHVNFGALLSLIPQTLLGIPLGLLSVRLINGMAYGWGQFARLMLGMSTTQMQLETARARAEQAYTRAERSDQSRRELIVNVSHDLRTPIASIRGHIESLQMAKEQQDGAPGSNEERAYLDIVQRETERLSDLVDDLLALARADAGELRLDVGPVAADGVVAEVAQALSPLAWRERQVTLIQNVPSGLPLVLADRQRLGQVLLNLVRNAITSTPAGGIVSLSLELADAGHLALTVADTGVGIPPQDLERIFERFYRTDASRTRATGGFGLGLAIVRDFVQAMGGTITVESAVGEGSRFRVLLRLATPTLSQQLSA
ncbi:MAG TPA: sensor domain-containing protein [Ktedonobacterales bacterium]